jgi:hypothetical protein
MPEVRPAWSVAKEVKVKSALSTSFVSLSTSEKNLMDGHTKPIFFDTAIRIRRKIALCFSVLRGVPAMKKLCHRLSGTTISWTNDI